MAKFALLIGVGEYGSGLTPLPAAVKDVAAMQDVLENPNVGEFDQVQTLINPERQAMEESIFSLFSKRKRDDLLLFYFSGHGIKDDGGNLYLAARNTRKEQELLAQPTAVAASFVQSTMNLSRFTRQVVILDCCFSGAFAEGMRAKDDGSVPIRNQLGGEGRAVLTSSTSTQYSFEHPGFDLSIYTHFLVEGIKTGIADRDRDGAISVDELHTYAREKVQETAPTKMKPEIYPVKEGGKILLAKVPQSNDPKLRYRQDVESHIRDGKISYVARNLLDLKRDSLGLSVETTTEIETEVLKPYLEYEKNLQRYRNVLSEAIQHENPLKPGTRQDLKDLQKFLALKDSDVTAIETQIIPQKASATELLRKLKISMEFVASVVSEIADSARRQVPIILEPVSRRTNLEATVHPDVAEYISRQLASRKSRIGATFIDYVLAAIPILLIVTGGSVSFFGFVIAFILIIPQTYFLSSYGQTIGKQIMKIKIVKISTGDNGGFKTNVLLRTLSSILLMICTFSIYFVIDSLFIIRRDKRCLHDLMANTCVISI